MRNFSPPVILAIMLMACSAAEEQAVPAAIPVQTITVASTPVPNVIELPGRVEAVRSAEVRARVTGIVQRQLYEEGTNVRAGQPLFRIDPAELRASYAQTEASLQRARATAANAAAVVERYRPLVSENAISRQEYDAAVAASREASANVAEIQAQLRSASLQLGYTTVRAPISGRAGRASITEGALVSQAEGTLMTRVEQRSPVYVSFSQSADEILAVRRGIMSGEIDLAEEDRVEVRLTLADGTPYGIPGYINFLGFSVAESTGTVELRAQFPNPGDLLLPGEFVRAQIFAGQLSNGILVPQRAVSLSENGSSVMVIDDEGIAQARPVELGAMTDGNWIITQGLRPGDVVITSNLQQVRPGLPVTRIEPENSPGTAAAATDRRPDNSADADDGQ